MLLIVWLKASYLRFLSLVFLPIKCNKGKIHHYYEWWLWRYCEEKISKVLSSVSGKYCLFNRCLLLLLSSLLNLFATSLQVQSLAHSKILVNIMTIMLLMTGNKGFSCSGIVEINVLFYSFNFKHPCLMIFI